MGSLSFVFLAIDDRSAVDNDGDVIGVAAVRVDPPEVQSLHPPVGGTFTILWIFGTQTRDDDTGASLLDVQGRGLSVSLIGVKVSKPHRPFVRNDRRLGNMLSTPELIPVEERELAEVDVPSLRNHLPPVTQRKNPAKVNNPLKTWVSIHKVIKPVLVIADDIAELGLLVRRLNMVEEVLPETLCIREEPQPFCSARTVAVVVADRATVQHIPAQDDVIGLEVGDKL